MKWYSGFAALVLVFLYIGLTWGVEICSRYPQPDPCLPGGVWDPVIQSCSGYARRPCFQGYSGPLCKEKEDALTTTIVATSGSSLFQVEYWMNGSDGGDPCTSVLGHYRAAYQVIDDEAGEIIILPPLEEAIKTLHRKTGNAVIEGHHLVTGIGATMVLNVAMTALSKKILARCTQDCPEKVDVFAQRPYYLGYKKTADSIPTTQWNPDADPNSPWTIEMNTYPNNPDGAKRTPLVTDSDRIITDMVYYWPMFSEIDKEMNESIMVFTSSKHDGLGGTRFGWALVKDPYLASDMLSVVSTLLYSFPVDIELRILTSMEAIISEGQGPDGLFPFHKFGRDMLYSRFSKLGYALLGCPHLELQNLNPTTSPGGYAWIHCYGEETCEEIFDKVNLTGISGDLFGTTAQDMRFSMLLPSVEFSTFLQKFLLLCSKNTANSI